MTPDQRGRCSCPCSKCHGVRKWGSVLFGYFHCKKRKRGCEER